MATGDKITCERCGKRMAEGNFYTYKNGEKCEICKACLTAYINNFEPSSFEWILKKLDVPYIPQEWNVLRDRAYAKDPLKMNGMSVIGKYLAKMKLKQWNSYSYEDSQKIQQELMEANANKEAKTAEQKKQFQEQLKEQLNNGEISQAQYKTLVSTETQNQETLAGFRGDAITGVTINDAKIAQNGYLQTLGQMKNPYQQGNFIPQSEIADSTVELDDEYKMYLAVKWGRLYTPFQWAALEKLYNQFMESFDIHGAARIDTLKMICKTSLKMNQAIDQGDVDTFQKLSRAYDSMMKSAKFTEAQNKAQDGGDINSASAIVDFVQSHSGEIPKYECTQPQDLVDKIILDLKNYNKSLIYQDKSLAQQIEKYLQDRKIMEQMRLDRELAQQTNNQDVIELQDDDYVEFKKTHDEMVQHDQSLNEEIIEEEFNKRRVSR